MWFRGRCPTCGETDMFEFQDLPRTVTQCGCGAEVRFPGPVALESA